MALEGDEEALNNRWCGGAKGWWICVLGRWEGVKDDGESLKGNWEKLNYDGEMSKSDRKVLKGQEKVLKVDGDALKGWWRGVEKMLEMR